MSEKPWNEAQAVARLVQGDQEALVRIYRNYAGLVYGVALRVLRNVPAAEDVVQEVFLQLWRNPEAFDSTRGHLAPWLAVITRHKAVDVLRKSKPELTVEDEPHYAESQSCGPDPFMIAEAQKAKELLSSLPPEQKRVLELAFLDGLTHVEIAARIGEPLGTVKSRIRLGLMSLRKGLSL